MTHWKAPRLPSRMVRGSVPMPFVTISLSRMPQTQSEGRGECNVKNIESERLAVILNFRILQGTGIVATQLW